MAGADQTVMLRPGSGRALLLPAAHFVDVAQ